VLLCAASAAFVMFYTKLVTMRQSNPSMLPPCSQQEAAWERKLQQVLLLLLLRQLSLPWLLKGWL